MDPIEKKHDSLKSMQKTSPAGSAGKLQNEGPAGNVGFGQIHIIIEGDAKTLPKINNKMNGEIEKFKLLYGENSVLCNPNGLNSKIHVQFRNVSDVAKANSIQALFSGVLRNICDKENIELEDHSYKGEHNMIFATRLRPSKVTVTGDPECLARISPELEGMQKNGSKLDGVTIRHVHDSEIKTKEITFDSESMDAQELSKAVFGALNTAANSVKSDAYKITINFKGEKGGSGELEFEMKGIYVPKQDSVAGAETTKFEFTVSIARGSVLSGLPIHEERPSRHSQGDVLEDIKDALATGGGIPDAKVVDNDILLTITDAEKKRAVNTLLTGIFWALAHGKIALQYELDVRMSGDKVLIVDKIKPENGSL
jgi:hypothetical protein